MQTLILIILAFWGFFFEKSRPGCLALAVVEWIGIYIILIKESQLKFFSWKGWMHALFFVYYRVFTNLKGT